MRTRYKTFEKQQPYFTTMTTVDWLPIFTNRNVFEIVIKSLKFLIDKEDLKIYAYVVLENHMHMVCASETLSNIMRRFKSFTARNIIDTLKTHNNIRLIDRLEFLKKRHKRDQDYQLWQEGYHPQLIQTEEMMKQKIEYIHNNPVKRGYVDRAEYWLFSSARNYTGNDDFVLKVELFQF
ncbi:MAG: REP-associated tyrosine transposase [Candidatus Anammoxibacter sp.]